MSLLKRQMCLQIVNIWFECVLNLLWCFEASDFLSVSSNSSSAGADQLMERNSERRQLGLSHPSLSASASHLHLLLIVLSSHRVVPPVRTVRSPFLCRQKGSDLSRPNRILRESFLDVSLCQLCPKFISKVEQRPAAVASISGRNDLRLQTDSRFSHESVKSNHWIRSTARRGQTGSWSPSLKDSLLFTCSSTSILHTMHLLSLQL